MDINKNIKLIDYISIILVLSYFVLHKIIIVFIGISLAIYIINKKQIIDIIKNYINKMSLNEILNNKEWENISLKRLEIEKRNSSLKLAERVEVLGFIPSADEPIDISSS
tara:strand:- start:1244 stop:1573 length:330 start_codon:yes stop_codon:yes gene_type:complete